MTDGLKKRVAIIGGGPAGLMAAEVLSEAGVTVTVFERMPTVGRKFLMAGRGGLNLTHSEPLDRFLGRYGPARDRLASIIEAFPPETLRRWSEGLGQPTFVGSSGRVFPKAMKASPLLRAWLARLAGRGVAFRLRHQWLGWNGDGTLRLSTPAGEVTERADAVVLALGGGSWPRLGSDGGWCGILGREKIGIAPLAPANSGVTVAWSEAFRAKFAGEPLKRISLRCDGAVARGEAVVTAGGLEGGAVYALVPAMRKAVTAAGKATVTIDLRPDVLPDDLARMLGRARGKQSLSSFLRKALRLPPVAIALMHEAALADGRKLAGFMSSELAALVKSVPITVEGFAPLATAISTAGGVALAEIDAHCMLVRKPGVFVAGEMLDWEAPTGGYLLQACFATGAAAGHGAQIWLGERAGEHRAGE